MTKPFDPEEHRRPDHAGPTQRRIPIERRPRAVACTDCGFINYVNPKIVVGAGGSLGRPHPVVLPGNRAARWLVDPSGRLHGGAGDRHRRRHARGLGRGAGPHRDRRPDRNLQHPADQSGSDDPPCPAHVTEIEAGPEKAEVDLFPWDEIPWDEIAFPTVHWALQHWRETRHLKTFPPFYEPDQGL